MKEVKVPKQTKGHEDSTMTVSLFCLAHCVVEFLAEEKVYEVSPFLRCAIYISVSTTFLTACLAAANSLPAKIKNALIGFGIYTLYALAAPVLKH